MAGFAELFARQIVPRKAIPSDDRDALIVGEALDVYRIGSECWPAVKRNE